MVDTDEFVSFNWFRRNEGAPVACQAEARIGRRRNSLNATIMDACVKKYEESVYTAENYRGMLPALGNETVASFIDRANHFLLNKWMLRYCIVVPRLTWGDSGTGEEQPDPLAPEKIPQGTNESHFLTLNFRTPKLKSIRMPGKSIIDISRYDPYEVGHITNPHRVLGNKCESGPIARYHQSLFRANHYQGSLQDFLRLGDYHKSEAGQFTKQASNDKSVTEEMTGWLKAFEEIVGLERALYLTQQLRMEEIEHHKQVIADLAMNKTLPFLFMPAESDPYLISFRKNPEHRSFQFEVLQNLTLPYATN